MTKYEKQRIDEDLASMLKYHQEHPPRQYSEGSEDDGNTVGNLLFALLMLILIGGPILVAMFGTGG